MHMFSTHEPARPGHRTGIEADVSRTVTRARYVRRA